MQRWGEYVSVEWEQTCRGVYALHVRHLGVEDLAMAGRARVEDLLVRLHCSNSTLALITCPLPPTPLPCLDEHLEQACPPTDVCDCDCIADVTAIALADHNC